MARRALAIAMLVLGLALGCGPNLPPGSGDEAEPEPVASDTGDPEPEPEPTPDLPEPTPDLPDDAPDHSCMELEAEYQALLTEVRACETYWDCVLHLEGDRCGCRYATSTAAEVETELLPLAEQLDALGCEPDCPRECAPANFKICNEDGLCEATTADK